MARDGFIGEDETTIPVLDVDCLRKVADQELDQQIEIDLGILVPGDAFERRATRRTGTDGGRPCSAL